MRFETKKIVVLALISGGILTGSFSAMAASNVANSKHNFAIGGGSNVFTAAPASGVTQVCIFCHTPHNAGQAKLLWNKATNAVPSFRLYTSSPTLRATTKQSTLPAGSPSLLCLGCHDGKTAMNVLHNSRNGVDAAGAGAVGYPVGSKLIPTANDGAIPFPMPAPLPMFGLPVAGMNIGDGTGTATAGDDLTNDHPIGFSYSGVLTDNAAGLHTLSDAKNAGVRFFGTNNRVECSTCHDPHVDSASTTLVPFLVKSNSGSALCLACHDK